MRTVEGTRSDAIRIYKHGTSGKDVTSLQRECGVKDMEVQYWIQQSAKGVSSALKKLPVTLTDESIVHLLNPFLTWKGNPLSRWCALSY